MIPKDARTTLDLLMNNTKTTLEQWLEQPNNLTLKQAFKDANLALLEFSRLQKNA